MCGQGDADYSNILKPSSVVSIAACLRCDTLRKPAMPTAAHLQVEHRSLRNQNLSKGEKNKMRRTIKELNKNKNILKIDKLRKGREEYQEHHLVDPSNCRTCNVCSRLWDLVTVLKRLDTGVACTLRTDLGTKLGTSSDTFFNAVQQTSLQERWPQGSRRLLENRSCLAPLSFVMVSK